MNGSSDERHRRLVELDLGDAFSELQTHCSSFLNNFSQLPLFNPNAMASFQAHLHSQFHTRRRTNSLSRPWARISSDSAPLQLSKPSPAATPPLTDQAIEERLAGVPVYALSNSRDEFVLVSGASSTTPKSLGLMCFKKEDADALLNQMKSMDPLMRTDDSKVVAVALNKVFQLKVDGVSFRLIPESTQVKNAVAERKKAGISDDGFPGVPVFQSTSLVLRSRNKSFRPVFFRKEDLEKSLLRASQDQKKLNPVLKEGGIEETSGSTWNDVVFIPPGFDVSTGSALLREQDSNLQEKSV
ncbi:Protein TIC 22-like, chloroplastic [Linum grandiflorum]